MVDLIAVDDPSFSRLSARIAARTRWCLSDPQAIDRCTVEIASAVEVVVRNAADKQVSVV